MNPPPEVNSRDFWEERFTQSWRADHGPEQTRFFGQLALATLPGWLRRQVQQQRLSVCDWGCAFGEGTAVLAQGLGTAVSGVDFSEAAIAQARLRHPALEFRCEDWLAGDAGEPRDGAGTYDIVFLERGQVIDAIVRDSRRRYDGISSSPADRKPEQTVGP